VSAIREWLKNLWRASANAEALAMAREAHRQVRKALDTLQAEEHRRLSARLDGSACGHPRQIAGDGMVLPCAWPGCSRGSRNPFLRVARRPDIRLWWPPEATPDALAYPPNLEYRRESATASNADPEVQWFWVLANGGKG
jgi:hypothetical protein